MQAFQPITDLLTTGTGRRETDILVDSALQSPDFFTDLVEIYLSDKEPSSRKAAWAVDICIEQQPGLIGPWVPELVRKMEGFSHTALKRHTLRILTNLPLPEQELGLIVKICFDWLVSDSEPVAVKVLSMELLYRASQLEPDLKKELADSIEWRLNEENAGFRNRGLKILKKLSREIG